jgi:hypothetical protein
MNTIQSIRTFWDSIDHRIREKIRRWAVGLHPFIALWCAFGLAKFVGAFEGFQWWTIPFAATLVGWIVFTLFKCANEFEWQ